MIGSNLDFGIKPPKSEFDVTNPKSINEILNRHSPSAILCLSNVNIRESEQNPLQAYKVNVIGVYYLTKAAREKKIPLILISTGAVFSGDIHESFNEDSTPNPLNIYGQTKYLAEILTLESSDRNLVIRTGWLFGSDKNSKKKNIFDKMLDLAIEGKEIKATYDQYGSPTYMKDLVSELKKLITNNASGIYHIVNSGRASAAEFIEEAAKYLKHESRIERASVAEFQSTIKRSPSECLDSKRIKLRHWAEALKDYLGTILATET